MCLSLVTQQPAPQKCIVSTNTHWWRSVRPWTWHCELATLPSTSTAEPNCLRYRARCRRAVRSRSPSSLSALCPRVASNELINKTFCDSVTFEQVLTLFGPRQKANRSPKTDMLDEARANANTILIKKGRLFEIHSFYKHKCRYRTQPDCNRTQPDSPGSPFQPKKTVRILNGTGLDRTSRTRPDSADLSFRVLFFSNYCVSPDSTRLGF